MFRRGGSFFQESCNHFESGDPRGLFGAEAGNPANVLLGAKPSPLALGVLTGADAHFFDRLRFREIVRQQEAQGLFVTEGLEWFDGGTDARGEQGADFVEQAAAPNFFAALIEMRVERFARRVEGEDERTVTGERSESRAGEMFARGTGGEQAEFEGAKGFVEIVGMDALGGGGIEPGEQAANGARPARLAGKEAGAERVIPLGAGGKAVEQGAEVKSGAAAENGEAAANGDLGEHGADFGDEITGGEDVGGGAEIDEMVGDAALTGGGHLGRSDVETGVDLDGIEVDNLAVEPLGEGESEGRLPRPGGSGDCQNRKIRHPA